MSRKYQSICSIFLLVMLGHICVAQVFPSRTNRLVNDYTSTLSSAEMENLTILLEQYEKSSSIEIAIVLMQDLGGETTPNYAFQLGEKWGIGKSGTDNGALMLVNMGDREIWIATGYGLEGSLPDAIVKRIVENDILPQFRQDRIYSGLKAGVESIIAATNGEYEGASGGDDSDMAQALAVLCIILLVFGISWAIKAVQVKEYARVNHLSFWAAWALLNSAASSHKGSWSTFSGGRGFSGGGFSGGSSFGGFGGGSFGGGGAGGRW
jgi:uncharacterized protein